MKWKKVYAALCLVLSMLALFCLFWGNGVYGLGLVIIAGVQLILCEIEGIKERLPKCEYPERSRPVWKEADKG